MLRISQDACSGSSRPRPRLARQLVSVAFDDAKSNCYINRLTVTN